MTRVLDMVRAFSREEDGIALTEYLILLGFFAVAVIVAVTAAGGNLAQAWQSWGTFWTTEVSYVPEATPDPE